MSDWVEKASFYLGRIHRLMESNLLNGGYLQLEETPIRITRIAKPNRTGCG